MDEEERKRRLQAADYSLFHSGDARAAYALLKPLLAEKNPEAGFLYSMFSFGNEETEMEFEARGLRLLKESADAGYPPAIFALSEWYVVDGEDRGLASTLLKKSVELAYPPAKLVYGLCLFHGEWPLQKDEYKGLNLIREAVAENAENAKEALEEIEALFLERGHGVEGKNDLRKGHDGGDETTRPDDTVPKMRENPSWLLQWPSMDATTKIIF
ncbi:MAG: hypothetical protein LBL72_10735 [Candidatus Accumulibacter sp.]|jgi:TPR repeat protein|nr:hypothetical protein [Accumulibacter sp.]